VVIGVLALVVGLARAQEAPPAGDDGEVVIVYDELRAKRAREKIMQRAEALGYTRRVEKDGRTILRHELPWKGELVLYDDGQVEVKRQPVRFEPPFAKKTPLTWMSCVIVPLCIRAGGQAVSPRRYHSYERELWATVADDVVDWNDRLADVGTGRKIEGLPERLDALWTSGVSLEGDAILETWESRRESLFRFWDTRTESSWGESVRDAVQAFILGEVETGDHPFTADEKARLNAGRLSSRPFPFRAAPSPEGGSAP
jgi:hypothetical protein